MSLTANDGALLKELHGRLRDKPLLPGDKFYEPIYSLPDAEDPVAKLRTRLEWADVESLQLFSGLGGTGKTTELFRLREKLQKTGCLVLYANALEYFCPSEEVDITTMLVAVAGAFGEQLERAGVRTVAETFWERLEHFLMRVPLQARKAKPGIEAVTPAPAMRLLEELKAGLDVKAALKDSPGFRQKVAGLLADRVGELKREVNAFIEESVTAVRKEKNQPDLRMVFLFDQFEHLRGSRSDEPSVIRAIERLFANHLELLRLPCVHVIYTVPLWLRMVLPSAFSLETLPSVCLWNNDLEHTRCQPGWDVLRGAILRRFEPEGFQRVFGSDPEHGQELMDGLLAASGGHWRDLLRLFGETLLLLNTWRPTLPATAEVIQRAIVNVRNDYAPIAGEDARWLVEVEKRRDTTLPDFSPARLGCLSRLLDTHLVLYRAGGKDWYDLHPLVRDEVLAAAKSPPATV